MADVKNGAGRTAEPPRHIAIIMDGNGRWATRRGLPRTAGHKAGAETFRRIATYCKNIGVKYLTVYAFSTENWKRSETEVSAIMTLLKKYLLEAVETMERDQIVRAARQFAEDCAKGIQNPWDLDEEEFSFYLDSRGIPDPELIIRPSGEMRISNFLLWQCAYSEFYITDTLWPDFDEAELDRAITAYQKRDRRFGGVKT